MKPAHVEGEPKSCTQKWLSWSAVIVRQWWLAAYWLESPRNRGPTAAHLMLCYRRFCRHLLMHMRQKLSRRSEEGWGDAVKGFTGYKVSCSLIHWLTSSDHSYHYTENTSPSSSYDSISKFWQTKWQPLDTVCVFTARNESLCFLFATSTDIQWDLQCCGRDMQAEICRCAYSYLINISDVKVCHGEVFH